MYVDFEIDDSGDLVFSEKKENEPQKISFNCTNFKAQKLAINFNNYNEIKNNSGISIHFVLNNNKNKYLANILTEEDATIQLIANKLKTTLGTLPERLNFGSKLSTFRHQNINDSNLKNLRLYLISLLSEDVPNIDIDIQPFIDYDNGYKQTVNITVYSSNKLLLEYEVER